MRNNKNDKLPALNKLLKDLRLKEEISQEKLSKRFWEWKSAVSSYENWGYLWPKKALKVLTKGFSLSVEDANAMITEAKITDDDYLDEDQKAKIVNIVKWKDSIVAWDNNTFNINKWIDAELFKMMLEKDKSEKEWLLEILKEKENDQIIKWGQSWMERLVRLDLFLRKEKKRLREEGND